MAAPSTAAALQRSARRFRRFAYLAAMLSVVCVIGQLLPPLAPLWRGGDAAQALRNFVAQADLAVPVVFFVWGLFRARCLFQRIESGEVFGADNSRDFRRIGWAIVGGAAWSLTLGGLIVPQTDPVSQSLAGVGLGARDFALLALGFALVVIGHMTAEARRIQADNDSFL
jgi:hypothetical protein